MELDAAFNTFQDYLLGSVLAVPRTIDIRYDDITGIRTDLTQAHEDALDESLEALRKKIIAVSPFFMYLMSTIYTYFFTFSKKG